MEAKDLELLGFEFLEKEGDKDVYINKSEFNRDEKIYLGKIKDDLRYVVIENNCGQFYFMGWLKNKKELKKLLKQVCIDFTLKQKTLRTKGKFYLQFINW